MKARAKYFGLALVAVIGGTSLVACSKDVYSKPDEVVCVYDREDGKLIKQLAPGSKLTETERDAEENIIVASNRFWNFTSSQSKDVASKGYIAASDATFKAVQAQGEINMKFFVPNACEWNSNYGRRSFKEGYSGMAFNVEGDPNTPWQVWLKRNFEDLLERTSQEVFNDYTWKQLRYQWPVNADPETGIVPEGQEVGVSVLREIEGKLSTNFTASMQQSLAGQYFCGPGYDPAKPDICPEIQIQLTKVDLVDSAPAQAFEQLQAKREQTLNAAEEAVLLEQSTASEVRAEKARLAKNKEIGDLQNQAAVEGEARKRGLLEAQTATKDLEAARAATDQLSVCAEASRINGAPITPLECSTLLLALQGKSPAVSGGGITINGSNPTDQ